MTIESADRASHSKVDVVAFFKKLGLAVADERPIMQGWREANAEWRRQRHHQATFHAQRVQEELRGPEPELPAIGDPTRARMGRPRPVWCVELQRCFPTLSAAAAFVGRRPSNISQSLARGVRCRSYHWEAYDAERHGR